MRVTERESVSNRERVRVTERKGEFTSVSSHPEIKILPEFVFKGKGKHVKLSAPENVHLQWSDSGSYRLEQLKKSIDNRFHPCSQKNYAIYNTC